MAIVLLPGQLGTKFICSSQDQSVQTFTNWFLTPLSKCTQSNELGFHVTRFDFCSHNYTDARAEERGNPSGGRHRAGW